MKLAAAALSLVLIVPGLAQSQPLVPPRLLYPGESPPSPSVPPPAPTPGSWPAANGSDVGINDPQCLALYGKTPAQIRATPCGYSSGQIPANTTLSACQHNTGLDLQGSNVKLDCVDWHLGAGSSVRCVAGTSCDNFVLRRVTGNGPGNAEGKLVGVADYSGRPTRTALIEDSDLSHHEDLVFCSNGVNSGVLKLPAPNSAYAFVLRHSLLRQNQSTSNAHSDLLSLYDCRGVLVENNRIDSESVISGNNISAAVEIFPFSSGGPGEFVFRNNYMSSDTNGTFVSIGRGSASAQCANNIVFDSNTFKMNSPDLLFYYNSGDRSCPSIASSPGSSCTNNVFLGGAPAYCTATGARP